MANAEKRDDDEEEALCWWPEANDIRSEVSLNRSYFKPSSSSSPPLRPFTVDRFH